MKCAINIKMDNAAFELDSAEELARILKTIDTTEKYQAMIDLNGNIVGHFEIIEEVGGR